MNNIFKIILFVLIVIAFFIFWFVILKIALQKQAKVECYSWQNQAKIYPLFYLTKSQKDQCDSLGIEINAPVK
jgi:uncharacterized alpha/beta hydrolase family protein